MKRKWKIRKLRALKYGLWVTVLLWTVPIRLFVKMNPSDVRSEEQSEERDHVVETGNQTVQDVSSGETEEVSPRVALTFDDGPSAQYTPELLEGLEKRGIRASFFVIGENIEKQGNAEILRRMKEDGHVIGNHTYTHVNLSGLSEEQALEELNKTDELIEKATGEIPVFARAPYGAEPLAKEKDLERIYVRWTVDPLDWMTEDAGQIVETVVREVQDGDVILLHDCYESSVRAALQIADILTERGYDFFTVEEMILE